jgi:hypothetical protein
MKHLLATLLLATLCATSYGQTIKSLGYNTTNNRVVGPTNTNALVFTNAPDFDNGAFFGGDVFIKTDGISFGGTERINLEEARFAGAWEFDQPATWRTNLGLGATWLTNTNADTFRSDIGIPLPALTNTNNADTMRALAGSTNTNQPFSGTVSFPDGNEDIVTVIISNGIILDVQVP